MSGYHPSHLGRTVGMLMPPMIPRLLMLLVGAASLLSLTTALACTNGPSPTSTPGAAGPGSTLTAETQQRGTNATPAPATSQRSFSRLKVVRDRGHLVCASSDAIPGFGYLAAGENAGFDIDLCRAVAAAALGDPSAVEFRVSIPTGLGEAVRSGEIDMVARILTATSTRDARWGSFVHTMYYDGQGFVVRRNLDAASARELKGASVCVTRNTTTELNLADFSNLHELNIRAVAFDKTEDAVDAYLGGECDAFTTDHSGLHAYLSVFPGAEEHVILPEVISEEPLTPLVPHGDEQWYDIVNSVMAILIYAEAYGVASDSVPTQATGNAAVDRLFGLEGSFGQEDLNLPATVAQDVVRAVGNYGEIYQRHLAPLGLERRGSRNALWAEAPCTGCPKGGQIYAPPLR